jgi:hypothetical protein
VSSSEWWATGNRVRAVPAVQYGLYCTGLPVRPKRLSGLQRKVHQAPRESPQKSRTQGAAQSPNACKIWIECQSYIRHATSRPTAATIMKLALLMTDNPITSSLGRIAWLRAQYLQELQQSQRICEASLSLQTENDWKATGGTGCWAANACA